MTNTIKIPVGAYESRNNYLVRDWSEYVFCPVEGHYLYKNHLEFCNAEHTI